MNSLKEVKTIKQVISDLMKDFRVAQHSGELGLANRFLRSAKDLEAIASEEEDLRDVEGALREMESEFCEEAIAATAAPEAKGVPDYVTDAMIEAVHGFELLDDEGLITWDQAADVARAVIAAATSETEDNDA